MTDQISKGPKDKKSWHSKHHVNIAVQRSKVFSNPDTIKWLSWEKVLFNPIPHYLCQRDIFISWEWLWGWAGIYLIGRGPAIDQGSANNKHQRYLQYRDYRQSDDKFSLIVELDFYTVIEKKMMLHRLA